MAVRLDVTTPSPAITSCASRSTAPEPTIHCRRSKASTRAASPSIRVTRTVCMWGRSKTAFYASDDGGETWRSRRARIDSDRTARSRSRSFAVRISNAGISIVFAGTEPSNLYRSDDGARSWESLPALLDVPSVPRWSFPPRPWTHHVRTIAPHPTDPARLTVGIELTGGVRDPFAVRWRGLVEVDHNPRAHSDAHDLRTHPLAPDRLYEAAGQGIARSDDGGETWARREDSLDRHYAWAQAIDPADPDLWYVSISRLAVRRARRG